MAITHFASLSSLLGAPDSLSHRTLAFLTVQQGMRLAYVVNIGRINTNVGFYAEVILVALFG